MRDWKTIARQIFQQTLAAIDIPTTIAQRLDREGVTIRCGENRIDLSQFRRVHAVAVGKAAYPMVDGLLRVLAPNGKATGVISAPVPPPRDYRGFHTFVSGHPVPNAESFASAQAALDLLAGCDERTLVFFLLSGGGSALMEKPLYGEVTLADVQALNRALVTCGAPIDEMNAVRKHLSAIKGGRLAAAAGRALKVTLGVSDVPQGRESALASGPTIPDPTTVLDAIRVVKQYGVLEKLPPSLRGKFETPDLLRETPKAGDPAFENAHFELLLGVHELFHSAHRAAESASFVTICDNDTDDWPLARAADYLLDALAQLKQQHPGKRVAVIADGEVSSPVTGDGNGGRNSAFVLDCVAKIAGKEITVLSAGTDGVDGNSPAAGAVADGQTLERARALGMDPAEYFRRSDAFTFFSKLGDAVETGPTGNNLRDLRILLCD